MRNLNCLLENFVFCISEIPVPSSVHGMEQTFKMHCRLNEVTTAYHLQRVSAEKQREASMHS